MNTDPSQHAQLFTELGEMNKLRQQAKDKDPEALQAVAEQFEQLFLNMLVKSMREANASFSEDSYFNSPQVEFYQQMGDTQLTKEIAENKGFGLAEILVRQLGGNVDPRLESDDEENRLKPLSESERMLNRTVDTAASMAASAILGQAQANSRALEKAAEQVSTQASQDASEAPEVAAVSVSDTASQEQTTAEPSQPRRFDTPEQFVATLLPLAESVAAELGVDPKVLLAQSALETGWGRYLIQTPDGTSHNLFNIKADSRWDGEKAQVGTVEFRDGVAQQERASFRVYDSYEQSFRDYADFLSNSPRYQQALEQAGDPYSYLNSLQQAGYATDPNYAEKIGRIFDGDVLAGLSTTTSIGSNIKES
ncbi:flagellar assembly peptidoglycan hydrolase FlgJ [Amphritea opalescens]|uniref:Peptidoglycan hydrolase FlgJ n=1 Tax=Amphritea opalescens TaxID=2490544 RepID=A0A430KTU2_9GAMM|nr:flagellar assembly peptidoglycan hydrolase FlgJ [Amphritea opalescens]RTE66868.1 flagellar assembly peptidoglycan hydrolase FlgJ [Amphritea opalescens]